MKILYLHQYFNTPEMSGSTRSYEMAKRLVLQGHEVHLITAWREKTDRKSWFKEIIDGIYVYWLPVFYSNHMDIQERIRAFFYFALKAGKQAVSLGGDVIFATSTPLTIGIPGIYAKRHLQIPMVFEVRDLWPELPIAMGALRNPLAKKAALLLERFVYKNSAYIIALSEGMAEGIISCGYPPEKVFVIPNGSDLSFFGNTRGRLPFRSKIPDLDSKPLITYAGTLGVINGVGYLVDIAVAAMEIAPTLRFLVVGKGKEENLIRQRASDSGVLNRSFFMLSSVPKNEIPDILAASDVALSLFIDLKPMWANSANKFFDALAAGRPVAVNYGGWQADLLERTGAGVRLPADDPHAAARILFDFVHDADGLKRAGAAARILAEEEYDRDKLFLDLERVLLDAKKVKV